MQQWTGDLAHQRGELRPNLPYEIWGYNLHVVTVRVPEGQTVDVAFHPAPYTDIPEADIVKSFKKSGSITIKGYFASVSYTQMSDAKPSMVYVVSYRE